MTTDAKPGAFINALTSAERKEVAVSRGLFAYFPDALALIARHSVRMNEKHNPGQPVHWSRGKSADHEDCIERHGLSIAIDPNSLDDGQPHIVCRAWRALAALQLWAEANTPAPDYPSRWLVQHDSIGVWRTVCEYTRKQAEVTFKNCKLLERLDGNL